MTVDTAYIAERSEYYTEQIFRAVRSDEQPSPSLRIESMAALWAALASLHLALQQEGSTDTLHGIALASVAEVIEAGK